MEESKRDIWRKREKDGEADIELDRERETEKKIGRE